MSYYLLLKYWHKIRIVFLSVVAVALSVSLLIVVASLFTGFIAAFERSAVEAIGDIVIRAPTGSTIEKYPAFIERLEQSDVVEAATASLSAEGLSAHGRRQRPARGHLGDRAGPPGTSHGVEEEP